MIRTHRYITVRDLCEGFNPPLNWGEDTEEIRAYNNKLVVKPKVQRGIRYDIEQIQDLFDSMFRGIDIGSFIWEIKEDGTFWNLSGLQRTSSILRVISGAICIKYPGCTNDVAKFSNWPQKYQKAIYNYELNVSIYENIDRQMEQDILVRSNITGKKMTVQENLNMQYAINNDGSMNDWLQKMKQYFCKTVKEEYNEAWQRAKNYINIKWPSAEAGQLMKMALLGIIGKTSSNYREDDDGFDKKDFEILSGLMEKYSTSSDWENEYENIVTRWEQVFSWANKVIGTDKILDKLKRRDDWFELYNIYHDETGHYTGTSYSKIQEDLKKWMKDDEIKTNSKLVPLALCKEENRDYRVLDLSGRAFSKEAIERAWDKQKGICPSCKKLINKGEAVGGHIKSWAHGGRTIEANLVAQHSKCNLHWGSEDLILPAKWDEFIAGNISKDEL